MSNWKSAISRDCSRPARRLGGRRTFAEMYGRFAPHTAIDITARAVRPPFEPVLSENTGTLKRGVIAPLGIPVAAGERLFTRHLYLDPFRERAADTIQPDVCHGRQRRNAQDSHDGEAHYMPPGTMRARCWEPWPHFMAQRPTLRY